MLGRGASPAADLPADVAHIGVYVTPYYNSVGPAIAVGRFSAGLASPDGPAFRQTIGAMRKAWNELSFAELYVAAIRLYDLGYRKEAVYWYYSGEYRGRLFTGLIDRAKMGPVGAPGYEILSSQGAFYSLVGPYINGYSFGDTPFITGVLRRVQKEGAVIPKMSEIYPEVAFIPRSQWDAKNDTINSGMGSLVSILSQKKDQIMKQRIDTGVEAKFSALKNMDFPTDGRP